MRHMQMKLWIVLAMAALALPALADVKAGDKPVINLTTLDGKPLTSQMLLGRVVVVDFWATWCGPCVAEMPHMKELYDKYSPAGMVMLGVSLDSDKAKAEQFAKDRGLPWPQNCEGKGWKTPMANAWGVNSIPRTFVIAPDGTVLWAGHPAQLDQPLEDAMIKYRAVLQRTLKSEQAAPKKADEATLAEAQTQLDAATAALKDNDFAGMLGAIAKIPDLAYTDNGFALRLKHLNKQKQE